MSEELKEEYSNEEECKQAVAEYNKDKKPEEEKRYLSYLNSLTHKRMYVPCAIKQFFDWRNMLAEEHRQRDLESRCLILSERYTGYKRCMEDCEHCPYGKDHREGTPLSLDQAYEDYELEVADEDEGDPIEKLINEKREEAVWREVSFLDETSQEIIKLFSEGLSDPEIAKRMGLTRKTVFYRRNVIIEQLKEKFKNF